MTRTAIVWGALLALGLAACGDDQTQDVRPQLVPPPDVVEFGDVPVLNEKRLQIDVQNVGRALLPVKRVALLEDDVPFRLLSSPDEVGPSDVERIEVAFVPPLEGTYEATLVLETEDPTNPSVTVKLTGVGSTRAVMEVDPLELDFGRVAEGTSAVRSFVIASTGSADLIVEALGFTEGTPDAFSFVGSASTPAVVAHQTAAGLPGQIQLTVRFTAVPGAPDVQEGALRILGTDPDNREVILPLKAAINRAPVAHIAELGVGAPGIEVPLDGSASHDPDGDDPITWRWTLRSKPFGATTVIEAPEQALTRMVLDGSLSGEYVVELTVTDAEGARSLTPARASIVAVPAEQIRVELFWNNTQTDVDLHFLRSPLTQVGSFPGDCFFQNKKPDWGVPGDDTDDPELLDDALTGFGPEVVGYVNPPDDQTFRVVAILQNTHGLQPPESNSEVTVRIYLYGVLEFEQKKVLQQQDQVWAVADLQWPAGVVTRLSP